MRKGAIVLDPEDEFERIVSEMVEMHRTKSKAYGARGDKLQNFYNIADAQGIGPLTACEHLAAKHASVIREYVNDEGAPATKYTDDAFLDRAVYSVLSKILYERGKNGSQS